MWLVAAEQGQSEPHFRELSLYWFSKEETINGQEWDKKCNKGRLNLRHPYALTSTKTAVGLKRTSAKRSVLVGHGCYNKLPQM